MNLSNELISQFAKITKDQNETSTESIVYGTAVMQGDKLYVNIDGSNTITPVVTSSEIKAGERVTVMIKDHTATVMGNISNPSASTETVGKVLDEYDIIVAKIGNFELLVADKVSTEQLEAKLATINEALIGKATIAELEAVKATIKDLDVSNLYAEIARIDEAIITKADIVDLDAIHAAIDFVEADIADIETLIGGNLTMDNIQSLVLTASKVTVDNAFIKDAMVDRISASKLAAGTVNTNLVNIASQDGSMNITGSLQQFKDADGNVRIQIGKDASGDFTFVLYGADGQGQLINQNGITPSAIGDGLIVNDMVADNAAIAGNKLDIDSVITEINGSTTTIKSSKIFFDETGQSLEVAFNKLETKIEDMGTGVDEGTLEQIRTNTTSINTMQGKINTLISNTTITKENGDVVQLKDEFSSYTQTVDGFAGKINSLETEGKNVSAKVSEFEATLTGFNSKLSETESKLSGLKIGGNNLVNKTTQNPTTYTYAENSTTYNVGIGQYVILEDVDVRPGDDLTASCFIESTTVKVGMRIYVYSTAEEGITHTSPVDRTSYVDVGSKGQIVAHCVVPEILTNAEGATAAPYRARCVLYRYSTNPTDTVVYSCLQMEKGNVVTDWGPSIQDTKDSISSIEETTSSRLSEFTQTLDQITTEINEVIAYTDENGNLVYVKDRVTETSTTLDAISTSVSYMESHFDEDGTVTNLTKQVSSLEQFASQFTMEFFQKIENADQGVNELLSYIHFNADGITIGQDHYPIRLMLTKDRIKFIDENETQVAYFSEGKLYVNNAEILDTFKIGNYGFMSTANGSLTIGALS